MGSIRDVKWVVGEAGRWWGPRGGGGLSGEELDRGGALAPEPLPQGRSAVLPSEGAAGVRQCPGEDRGHQRQGHRREGGAALRRGVSD